MLVVHDGKIVNTDTGEIITNNVSPKFSSLTYDEYREAFPQVRFFDPMSCFEHEVINGGLDLLPTEGVIYQLKYDGHRALTYLTDAGNRSFSRRISKKTGWYSENSDCIPHIRDFYIPQELRGSVLDGEMTLGENSMDMQSVMGSLPETAIANQINVGFCKYYTFDLLYYRGNSLLKRPLHRRLALLWQLINALGHLSIKFAPCFTFDKSLVQQAKFPIALIEESPKNYVEGLWDSGKEGTVYKLFDASYENKKSMLWRKVKKLFLRDVVIMGYNPPTKTFKEEDRKTDLKDWQYWEGDEPVTKPYAMGWIGSINCGVYRNGKLFKVAEVKGLSDEALQHIKEHSEELIGECIEIKFNDYIDDSRETSRHPRFSRWRDDKNAAECTFEAWTNRPESKEVAKPRRMMQKKKTLRK